MINIQHSILTAGPARELHYHHVTFNVTLTYPSNTVLLFDINKPSVSDVGTTTIFALRLICLSFLKT